MASKPSRLAAAEAPKRRPKGSGSFYYIAALNRWAYSLELRRGSDGKRRRRIIYGATEAEVKRKVADLTVRGGGTLRAAMPTKVSEHVAAWLPAIKKRLKPKTFESYEWAWKHASPLIGGVRLDKFDRLTVLELFDELQRKGASANTIRHVARVMQTAIEDAIADGIYTDVNPFTTVKKQKPKHSVSRGRALSVDEARRFIAACRNDRLEAAWILGLTAGLRIGEMFGLQWADIDFAARTVFVQRQALFVSGKLIVDDLKTADSLRLIPIGSLAMDALERRRDAAQEETPSIWVFPAESAASPISPNNARRRNFAAAVKRAGILGTLTPHDLRHSMNSFGDAAGIPEKVRSERMGHADSAITRRVYTHTIDGQAREAAQKIDELLVGDLE